MRLSKKNSNLAINMKLVSNSIALLFVIILSCTAAYSVTANSDDPMARLGDTLFDAGMERFGDNRFNDSGLDDTSDVIQKYVDICTDSTGIVYSVFQKFSASTGTTWDIMFSKNTSGLSKSSDWKDDYHSSVRVDDTGNGSKSQIYPKLDVYGSGSTATVVAVWQDDRAGDSSYNIYAAKSVDAGLSFFSGGTPNMRVDDTGINQDMQKNPDIAIAPDGTAHAVWADSREGNYRIYTSKLELTNNTFSPNIKVSNYNIPADPTKATQGQDLFPSIAIDSAGVIYVAWEYQIEANLNNILTWDSPTRNDAIGQIWFSKSTDKGATWSNPTLVSLGGSPSNNHNPIIGVERKNTTQATDYIHFTWDGRDGGANRNIFYARSLADGSGMTNVKVSNFTAAIYNKTHPSMNIDSFGNVNIVWQDDRYSVGTGSNIMFTKSPDRGLHFYSPIKIDSAVQNLTTYSLAFPSVTSWRDGDVFISWHDNAKASGRDNSALAGNTRAGGETSVWSAGSNIAIPKVSWITIYDTIEMEDTGSVFSYNGNIKTDTSTLGSVALESAIKITFSKPIDSTTINSSNFKLFDENSLQVAGTYQIEEKDLVFDKDGKLLEKDVSEIDMITAQETLSKGSVVTFIPSGSLNYSQTYKLILYSREPGKPQGICDKLGYGFTYNNYYTPSTPYVFVAELNTKSGSELRISELYNSPNPTYDGTTVINYNLHFEPSEVTLKIYNTDGNCINNFDISANYGSNRVNFNCVDDAGDVLKNGVYFYLVRAVSADTGEVVEMWEKLAVAR